MELTFTEKKVMGKVIRYFQSLEEMAAYLGIDVDDLISKIKNSNVHLHIEKTIPAKKETKASVLMTTWVVNN
jgi:hypothetical protein